MIKLTEQIAINTLYEKIEDQKAKQSHIAFWYAIAVLFNEDHWHSVDITIALMKRGPAKDTVSRISTITSALIDELEAIELIT